MFAILKMLRGSNNPFEIVEQEYLRGKDWYQSFASPPNYRNLLRFAGTSVLHFFFQTVNL